MLSGVNRALSRSTPDNLPRVSGRTAVTGSRPIWVRNARRQRGLDTCQDSSDQRAHTARTPTSRRSRPRIGMMLNTVRQCPRPRACESGSPLQVVHYVNRACSGSPYTGQSFTL
jgi:hypothetical protein